MPELPEVERARKLLERCGKGKTIIDVKSRADEIVFKDCTSDEFATSVRGKKVERVERLGKYFYMVLSCPPHPVMHFGMSGACSIRGEGSIYYRKKPKNSLNEEGDEWPPRYWKFALAFAEPGSEDVTSEWAFMDARRLGRVRLVNREDPLMVEPLSLLGRGISFPSYPASLRRADPLLGMPSIETFQGALSARSAPIKAVLLDQNTPLSGLGNWMVDEILFQSKIHPSYPANALDTSQVALVHENVQYVAREAVHADADYRRFPDGWLFKHRWGKGKKGEPLTFTLSDGSVAKIIYSTVGGRTSAIVEGVQSLPRGGLIGLKRAVKRPKAEATEEEQLEIESTEKQDIEIPRSTKKQKRRTTNVRAGSEKIDPGAGPTVESSAVTRRRSKRLSLAKA